MLSIYSFHQFLHQHSPIYKDEVGKSRMSLDRSPHPFRGIIIPHNYD
jgi:hypothetical protein